MIDLNELIGRAQLIANDAQIYLKRRSTGVVDLEERARLEDLSEKLKESSARVRLGGEDMVVLEEPTLKIFSEKLDLARKHVLDLDVTSDYIAVESVVGGLNHNLQTMAGPHGPGKGKPDIFGPGAGGWGKGKPPGWDERSPGESDMRSAEAGPTGWGKPPPPEGI